jgi:NAD-dependent DNA ligase
LRAAEAAKRGVALRIEFDIVGILMDNMLEDKMYEKPQQKSVDQTHPLFGKNVVLTGTRDKDIIELLKNVGANQGSSVSKSTFLVVAKNKDEDTGKAEEARKLHIPIMSVEEFIQTYINK